MQTINMLMENGKSIPHSSEMKTNDVVCTGISLCTFQLSITTLPKYIFLKLGKVSPIRKTHIFTWSQVRNESSFSFSHLKKKKSK